MVNQRLFLPLALPLLAWLALKGVEMFLGVDTGPAGFAVLTLLVVACFYSMRTLPREEIETLISPGEWRAWISLAFLSVSVVYLAGNFEVFQVDNIFKDPHASAVGRHLVMLLIGWTIVLSVVERKQKGVLEDERDQQIEHFATRVGQASLTVLIVVVAFSIGLTPGGQLAWATRPAIATLLLGSLMLSSMVAHGATVARYWMDRR